MNYNQLSHEQRAGGIQQMPKTPDEYRLRYNLTPITLNDIQEDVQRFDAHLAQQVTQNMNQVQHHHPDRFPRGGPGRRRGRGRPSFSGQQAFRSRAPFPSNYGQNFNPGTKKLFISFENEDFTGFFLLI